MGFNIEIKAGVGGFAAIEDILYWIGAERVGILEQKDEYFHSAGARVKIRTEPGKTPELIYYQRPDQNGPKASSYERYSLADAPTVALVLSKILGQRGVIKKKRLLYLIDETRIHLDEVEGLGRFIEFEVVIDDESKSEYGRQVADRLLDLLKIDRNDLITGSYIDLIEETGRQGVPSDGQD